MIKVEYFISGRRVQPQNLAQELNSRVEEFILMQLKAKLEQHIKSKLSAEDLEKVSIKIEANGLKDIKASITGPDDLISKVNLD